MTRVLAVMVDPYIDWVFQHLPEQQRDLLLQVIEDNDGRNLLRSLLVHLLVLIGPEGRKHVYFSDLAPVPEIYAGFLAAQVPSPTVPAQPVQPAPSGSSLPPPIRSQAERDSYQQQWGFDPGQDSFRTSAAPLLAAAASATQLPPAVPASPAQVPVNVTGDNPMMGSFGLAGSGSTRKPVSFLDTVFQALESDGNIRLEHPRANEEAIRRILVQEGILHREQPCV